MKMKRIAMGFALLVLTTSAMAFNGERRPSTNGAIVWSTRDRDGNQFGIVFQFGRQVEVHLDYREGRRDRYDRYDRDDRYDRYDRYDRRDFRHTPPLYDYKRYKGRDYDHRYFSCYEEWADWKVWQGKWSKRKHWQRDERERSRAWQAFQYERNRALDRYVRDHRDDDRKRNKRGRRDDD